MKERAGEPIDSGVCSKTLASEACPGAALCEQQCDFGVPVISSCASGTSLLPMVCHGPAALQWSFGPRGILRTISWSPSNAIWWLHRMTMARTGFIAGLARTWRCTTIGCSCLAAGSWRGTKFAWPSRCTRAGSSAEAGRARTHRDFEARPLATHEAGVLSRRCLPG